ncbi:hypothetical protein DFH29DRAFT_1006061 [Suillus ampliporus]|nr:hypothetical protein DFH29DRAFT_1006061 [Suillus ampliporus]
MEQTIPKPKDIVILVIGVTGGGKTTFINTAVGRRVNIVDDGLDSCTQYISCAACPRPDDNTRRIIFVDTPGFNNSSNDLPDGKILKDIAGWLAGVKRTRIAGIIVLHDLKYLPPTHVPEFIRKLGLCGLDALTNVILATRNVQVEAKGQKQEKELEDHWKRVLKRQPKMIRFRDTNPESAWEIVKLILQNHSIDSLEIRPQVENGRSKRSETTKDVGRKCNIM